MHIQSIDSKIALTALEMLFVSKFNLLKGYCQVPLTEEAMEVFVFVTPDCLNSCRVLQFEMKYDEFASNKTQ